MPLGPCALLTPREREVARLLLESGSVVEVADLLVLSAHTVETHLKNARGKVGAHSLSEFVAWCACNRSCCLGLHAEWPYRTLTRLGSEIPPRA